MAKDKVILTGGFEAEVVSIAHPSFDEEPFYVWLSDNGDGTWSFISAGDEDDKIQREE